MKPTWLTTITVVTTTLLISGIGSANAAKAQEYLGEKEASFSLNQNWQPARLEPRNQPFIVSQIWRNDRYDDRYDDRNRDRYSDRYGNEINRVYRQVLSRRPSNREERYWARELARGRSLNNVRRELAYSREAEQEINRIYREVLGRNADSRGLRTWTRRLAEGSSLREVRRDIERSNEARRRY